MTTGGNAEPPNGLWRILSWEPRMDLHPEFLCQLQGMQGGMVADVAVTPHNDVIVVDLACRLHVIRRSAYAQLTPTADKSMPCPTTFIGVLNVEPGHTCTGISGGSKSNLLMVSLNDGDVVELEFTRSLGGSLNNAITSSVTAKSDPFATSSGSAGGTDVTIGPDGQLYRFTARDLDNSFSATRFEVDSDSRQLTGSWSYTNRALSEDEGGFSNAGTFCTRDMVVGVAARTKKAGMDDASFFSYGLATSGDDVDALPAMELVARTVTTDWPRALRVNGAANKPKCG